MYFPPRFTMLTDREVGSIHDAALEILEAHGQNDPRIEGVFRHPRRG